MAASSSSTHHLVEFDFFRMEKEKASSQPQTQPSTAKIYERKRSFRGSKITKILLHVKREFEVFFFMLIR